MNVIDFDREFITEIEKLDSTLPEFQGYKEEYLVKARDNKEKVRQVLVELGMSFPRVKRGSIISVRGDEDTGPVYKFTDDRKSLRDYKSIITSQRRDLQNFKDFVRVTVSV